MVEHPRALGRAGRRLKFVGTHRVACGAQRPRPGDQLAANAGAHLGGGPFGEREGEDPVDRDLVVGDRSAVAVDEHRRLPRPGPGFEEGVALARGDRLALFGGRRALARLLARAAPRGRRWTGRRRLGPGADRSRSGSAVPRPRSSAVLSSTPIARSSRQIAWKLQYLGQRPPIGWRRISPARISRGGGRPQRARPRRGRARKSSSSRRSVPTIPRPLRSSSSRARMPAGLRSPTRAERVVEAADGVEPQDPLDDPHVELDLELALLARTCPPR